MKRITAILHTDFEKQTKDLLNEIADWIDKQTYERKCNTCTNKAIYMSVDLESRKETSFCGKCLK